MKARWSTRVVWRLAVLACAVVMALGNVAWAEALRLPAIFAEHGVVQRDVPVPVWGWAEAGAPVSVSMAGQTVQATADGDGRWRVDLAPMAAGGPHELTVSSGSEVITLTDQLVGEVWLASGQSNMQWSIKLTENFEEELATCENDAIRFTMLYREHSPMPLDDVRAIEPWFPCTEQAILDCYDGAGYSAVSYYFAKYLQAELGVPVGVINTSWGGTRIEPWTPPAGFEQVSALKDIALQVRRNSPGTSDYRKTVEAHMGRVETWLADAKSALEQGGYVPVLPAPGSFSPLDTQQAPTTLYNAMVHPLVPYANRGFIWYQGESNRGEGMLYRDKMEALIRGWRTVWGNNELACHFVQLAPFTYGDKPEALPEIWEAQEATLDIPHTGMAVINDIGDIKDIHPVNKNDVGKRLAWLALNKTYGRHDIPCDSPLFDRFDVEGGAVRVYFKHAQALQTRDGAAPTWFALSGADGVFHAAEAVIDGATVVLKAAEVAEPTAVRFAWHHTAEPNLMNEAGLPAAAFRAPRPAN